MQKCNEMIFLDDYCVYKDYFRILLTFFYEHRKKIIYILSENVVSSEGTIRQAQLTALN